MRVLRLTLVIRGSGMASTFVPVVLGYKVTTFYALGLAL